MIFDGTFSSALLLGKHETQSPVQISFLVVVLLWSLEIYMYHRILEEDGDITDSWVSRSCSFCHVS